MRLLVRTIHGNHEIPLVVGTLDVVILIGDDEYALDERHGNLQVRGSGSTNYALAIYPHSGNTVEVKVMSFEERTHE